MLTHEIVHTLLMAELGLQRVAKAPMWKQEGYADYVAASTTILADPDYDIRERWSESCGKICRSWSTRKGIFRYGCLDFGVLRDEEQRIRNTCYYISHVLVEYVLDHQGMTFQDLMNPGITDSETLTELIAAYEDGTLESPELAG